MITRQQQRVVDAALQELDRLTGNDLHTVAAAAMDTEGRIHTGVNVFHFTGGPCAKLTALGQAAGAPLVTMVAVADVGRGAIPPCGRCRQVLLDQHPDCDVILPIDGTLAAVPVRKLLPYSYTVAADALGRIIRFHPRYYEAVLDGTKTATTRFDEPCAAGPAWLLFEFDEGYRRLRASVDSVTPKRFDQITDEDAQREGCETAAELQDLLRTHYPEIRDDAVVEVVRFRLEGEG
ncbi:ASCH domain-containing protein [Brachybacterium sp. JHP9]|uniref:ASCH domain-containing protein n=1 Tax=Brachybacterium equifaecis TaxID=2910770 RepID=A0ABT0R3C7_9MICO|nr:ASCH domain-containing protein [Brachybacterium equifaecis]MCL6424427.1 ASCH domain-containing protein [Brachybacterium equifaecis]